MRRSTAAFGFFRLALVLVVLAVCTAATSFAADATSTSLAVSPATNFALGTKATLTASVTDSIPTGVPTGTVNFFDNGALIGSAQLTGATAPTTTAIFTSSVFVVGPHKFTAAFVGNAGFATSNSNASPQAETVVARGTTTSIPASNSVQVRSASPVVVTVTDLDPTTGLPVAAAGTSGTLTATLTTARVGATATRLLDGTVLIVGGSTDGTAAKALGTAEIFDPNGAGGAGTFTALDATCATPSKCLGIARFGHSATLLADGTVLIAGGENASSAVLASSEIYDPTTQTFAAGGSLKAARTGQAATLLPDGSVLVVGGSSDGTAAKALTSAEIYSGGTFTTATGFLGTARLEPTATLLPDGTVVIVGGETTAAAADASTEIFSPGAAPVTTGKFSAGTATLNTARFGHTATLVSDNTVLIAGGTKGTTVQNTFEIYDALMKNFVAVKAIGNRNLATARSSHAAALLNTGTVLIVGGINVTTGSAEQYLPAYDPQGVVSLASDNGGAGTPDTVSGCTLILTGTGVTSCTGSVTPNHVNTSLTHNITAQYVFPDWSLGTAYALNALILPSSANGNASGFIFEATAAGTSGSSAPTFDLRAPNVGETVPDNAPLTWLNVGLSNHSASTSGNEVLTVNRFTVNVTGITVSDKPYDATVTVSPSTINTGAAVIGGLQNGDNPSLDRTNISGVFTPDANVGANKTVDISGLALSGTNAGDYQFAAPQATATASITAATLIYVANPANRIYGSVNPSLRGTVTGFVGSDTQANATTGALAFTTTAVQSSNAGNYPINGSGLTANNGNYVFVQAAANATAFTINPATLTYTATAASRSYGAANSTFSGTVAGFVLSDTQANATTGTLAFLSPATAASVVGSYAINGSGLTANNGNYVFVQAAGNATALTVTPAPLTITANNRTKTYGITVSFAGTEFTVTGALFNGDSINSVVLVSPGTIAAASVAGSPYTITASAASGAGVTNYAITYNPGTLQINPALLTITANNDSKIYGATKTYGAGSTAFTSTGLQNGEAIGTVSLASTGGAASATAGSYSITPSAATGGTFNTGNYSIAYANGILTVGAASLTITANSTSKTYGSTVTFAGTEFTTSGLVNSDTVTSVTLSSTGAPTFATVAGSPYSILPSSPIFGTGSASNYTISFVNGSLAVNRASLTITANNRSKTYGQPVTFSGSEFTTSGLVNGDTVTNVTLSSTGAVASATVAGGPYSIVPSSPVGTGLSNYTPSFVNGSLTLSQAALAVAANNQSRAYGVTNPTLDGPLTGVTAGDTITASFSTAATSTSPIGNYAIMATLNDPGSRLGNYSVTNTPGTLTVTQSTLVITPNNKARTYGDPNPALDGTVTGVTAGDNITASFSTAAVPTSTVGSYPITSTIGDPGNRLGNYTVSQPAGTLTINKAQITMAANDKARVYGGANPTLDGSLTGVTAGDSITDTFSTAATPASVVGAYPITATLNDPGNRLGNYNVANTSGTLTISTAPLTITANSSAKTFGQTVTFAGTEFTTRGLVNNGNGDAVNSVTLASGGAASLVAVGAYNITPASPSGSGLGNYAITFVPGSLTVGPATTNSVVVSPQSAKNGATFTFIGTVAPEFAGVPGGTITFMDNGSALASKIPLVNGTASFTTTVNELAAGQTHTITAVYNKDDPNFAAATTQVGASITVGAALATTPGAPIQPQTLQLANPGGGTVTYSGLSCGVLDAFGNTVKNTICTATPAGSFTLPAPITLTIATSNGNSTTAFSTAPADARRVHALESLWLAMPAMVLLPLAIPAETRRKLRQKKALFLISLLLALCVVLVSAGCGGGNGFSNPNNQQPGTVGTAATPNGSYVVQIVANNQQGQSVAVASIPLTVAAN